MRLGVFCDGNEFCDFEVVGVMAVVYGCVKCIVYDWGNVRCSDFEKGGADVVDVWCFVEVEFVEKFEDVFEGGVLELELWVLVWLSWWGVV